MALTPADRARRYRQRQSKRIAIYQVAGGDGVLLALLKSGLLTDAEARDRTKVEAALSAIVTEWARRWAK